MAAVSLLGRVGHVIRHAQLIEPRGACGKDGRRKTEDGRRKTEDGRRKTEGGGRGTEGGRRRAGDGEQNIAI